MPCLLVRFQSPLIKRGQRTERHHGPGLDYGVQAIISRHWSSSEAVLVTFVFANEGLKAATGTGQPTRLERLEGPKNINLVNL